MAEFAEMGRQEVAARALAAEVEAQRVRDDDTPLARPRVLPYAPVARQPTSASMEPSPTVQAPQALVPARAPADTPADVPTWMQRANDLQAQVDDAQEQRTKLEDYLKAADLRTEALNSQVADLTEAVRQRNEETEALRTANEAHQSVLPDNLLADIQVTQRAWSRQLSAAIATANAQLSEDKHLQDKLDQAQNDMIKQNIDMEKLQRECDNLQVKKDLRLDMVQKVAAQELRIKQLERQLATQATAQVASQPPNLWEPGAPMHRSDGRAEVERDGLAWHSMAQQAWAYQRHHHISAYRRMSDRQLKDARKSIDVNLEEEHKTGFRTLDITSVDILRRQWTSIRNLRPHRVPTAANTKALDFNCGARVPMCYISRHRRNAINDILRERERKDRACKDTARALGKDTKSGDIDDPLFSIPRDHPDYQSLSRLRRDHHAADHQCGVPARTHTSTNSTGGRSSAPKNSPSSQTNGGTSATAPATVPISPDTRTRLTTRRKTTARTGAT
jgi:hypothetical protein